MQYFLKPREQTEAQPGPQLFTTSASLVWALIASLYIGNLMLLVLGLPMVGLVMRRFNFPTAPVLVGMILGPLAEAQLRNAISIGEGSAMIFLQRPMSLAILIVVVAVLLVPRLVQMFSRKRLDASSGLV